MSKIAIVTDSNSGITQDQAKEIGIRVLPMPFMIDGETYYEEITLSRLAGTAQSAGHRDMDDLIVVFEERIPKLCDGLRRWLRGGNISILG